MSKPYKQYDCKHGVIVQTIHSMEYIKQHILNNMYKHGIY